MKILLSVICLLLTPCSEAQKQLKNTFVAQNIRELIVDSDAIFKIQIKAVSTPTISIKTGIEGETFESALVLTEQKDDQLIITTGRSPEYVHYDDKLAAHKVMSVELTIEIPENLAVTIISSLASVRAEGNFGSINWSLRDGDVRLFRFRGSGIVNTVDGTILVETEESSVAADSRNGHLAGKLVSESTADLVVRSINGDILVTQSQ